VLVALAGSNEETTMKQAIMTAPGRIELRDVPLPEVAPDQVLIRVKRIGVCGSDIHVFHGKHPLTPYPVVQGHEASGVVERTGSAVRGLSPGDPVTFQPQVTCGVCHPCRHGAYHICDRLKVMGFQTTGAASELFAVDATKVLRLPKTMSMEQGAMVEPLAVGVHALERVGGASGKKVLVLGAGPIGNLVAQAARGLGAAAVMITDTSDYRLELAERCGIPLRVNPLKVDLGEAVRERFGADKADLIFECVGVQKTVEQAVSIARKGTDVIVVGVFGDKPVVDMGTVQDRELRLVGALMYQQPDWVKAIALIEQGKVDLEPLVTNRFAFADYQKAYEYIDANRERAMKVMIVVDA